MPDLNKEFLAVRVEKDKSGCVSRLVTRRLAELPPDDLLIRVAYSSLNYKDLLASEGHKGVVSKLPHTPGIDAAGKVEKVNSGTGKFHVGDEVIVTGYDLGVRVSGGFAEYISVPETWVVQKPQSMTLKDCMAWGTAGLTAAISVDTLLQVGIHPSQGEVLVTGASGGVGSIACMILAGLDFEVVAGTSQHESRAYFDKLGVAKVMSREALLEGAAKPMLKERWAAAVDTVGGDILFNALKSTRYGGSVTCCGMAASAEFHANVYPFILRGVNLMGVDSVELPLDVKSYTWASIAKEWHGEGIWNANQEIALSQIPEYFAKMKKGELLGHYAVKVP